MTQSKVEVGTKVRLKEVVYGVQAGQTVEIASINSVDPDLFYFKTWGFMPIRSSQFDVVS